MNASDFYREVNNTKTVFPTAGSLHGHVAESAHEFEDQTAVVFENESLTYSQFNSSANRFANYLIQQGVQNGDLVGVCCDRNLDLPVILHGILRAGAGYVPLDPDYPADRLLYMVEDSGLKHVVAQQSQAKLSRQFGVQVHPFEQLTTEIQSQPDSTPFVEVNAEQDVAYVIYTSGSTG
ncbi:MAG: AMP-binding protein, partial [Planctomycetota bacterium]